MIHLRGKLVLLMVLLVVPAATERAVAQQAATSQPRAAASARVGPDKPDWVEPFPPFHVAGNIYSAGTKGLGAFIITTPQGNILISSTVPASVPQLKANMEKLNLKYSDIKLILHTHAHYDHIGGNPLIQKETGAKYLVMDRDVPVVEKGGRDYPATKVDRVLHDGEKIELGGTVITAHSTPGHTPGCATYTMTITDAGKTYNVAFLGGTTTGSPGAPPFKLVNRSDYPEIVSDYRKSYRYLKSISPDIWLGAHGSFFNIVDKYPRLKPGQPNPFIDPDGYKKYIDRMSSEFEAEVKKQEEAAKRSSK